MNKQFLAIALLFSAASISASQSPKQLSRPQSATLPAADDADAVAGAAAAALNDAVAHAAAVVEATDALTALTTADAETAPVVTEAEVLADAAALVAEGRAARRKRHRAAHAATVDGAPIDGITAPANSDGSSTESESEHGDENAV